VRAQVEVQCPEGALGGVYSVLNQKRGMVFEEVRGPILATALPLFTGRFPAWGWFC